MENRTQTIRKIFNSRREDRYLKDPYLSSSMTGKNSTELGMGCTQVSFIVEWQMEENHTEYKNTELHK